MPTLPNDITLAFRELARAASALADAFDAQASAAAEAQPTPAPEAPAASAKAHYQAAADAVLALIRDAGRGAALDVLAQFSASKLPDVAPHRLPEVRAAAEQAREAHAQAKVATKKVAH